MKPFRPGLHDIGSLFMPDRFHESDTENAPECVNTQRVVPNSGAERIGFIRSRVNKTPIRYETESDTLVIRYGVNGALVCHYVPSHKLAKGNLTWCADHYNENKNETLLFQPVKELCLCQGMRKGT